MGLRELTGPDVDVLLRQALECRHADRWEDAEAIYRVAVELAPAAAAAHHNLGGVYKVLGRLDEAEVCCRRALALAPDEPVVRHALGTVLLSQGDFAQGFAHYAARHDLAALNNPRPCLPFPEWTGEDVGGKRVLVIAEQGYGDLIQFARFVRTLAGRGANVTVATYAPLMRLFAENLDVCIVGAKDRPQADAWVMASSLAWRLGITPETIPGAPYLISTRRDARGRIGVMARGDPRHPNDLHRSLDAASESRLLALPGAVSLAPADTGATDFSDTAAIVQGLDLVVTVDTAVAHLAGAMGKPTWILLPASNRDWRWPLTGDRTPWYPTARLFGQAQRGDWGPTVSEVIDALGRF